MTAAMTAFEVGQLDIHSRDWMEADFARIPDVVAAHSGRFPVSGGNPSALEGDRSLPDAAFILRFPDRDHARAFRALAAF